DRLAVDLRLALQHRELDPEADAPARRRLRRLRDRRLRPEQPAAVAGQRQAGDVRHHRRAGLADPAVRGRDLHRRARLDPDRGRRRGEDRRRVRVEEAVLRHAPATAADRARRRPLRDRLHGRRLRRRLRPHARRAVQLDPGADHVGVPDRDRVRLARGGRCDLALPLPAPRRRHRADALLRETGAGLLMDVLRAIWRRSGTWVVVGPFAIVLAFPFYWALTTMFKRDLDLYNAKNVPYAYNDAQGHAHWDFWNYMTFHHVSFLFKHTQYPTWLENTVLVGVAVVAITLVLSLPAGYALARLSGGWGQSAGVGIFLVYLVPPTLLFLPLSRLVAELGLRDTLWAMILVYPSFTVPFATWLLMGFFKTIPQELEDAALVDGCSRLRALRRIVFPVSLPGILTVVIF